MAIVWKLFTHHLDPDDVYSANADLLLLAIVSACRYYYDLLFIAPYINKLHCVRGFQKAKSPSVSAEASGPRLKDKPESKKEPAVHSGE